MSYIGSRTNAQRLLDLLRQGHAFTKVEAAERLEVSTRQVQRLIRQIKKAGIEVCTRQRGFKKEYVLPPPEQNGPTVTVDLTEQQALALVLASKASASVLEPTPLHDALTQAFDRLLEQMPGAVATFEPGRILSRVHVSRTGACLIEPGVVDGLLKAIGGQQVVTVDYYTASRDAWTKGRSITPWAVAVRGDTWLCVGYCHLRREPRDFNLARMSRLRLGPRSKPEAEPPENFDLDIYFSDRFEAMDGATREVRLRVGPGHAQYFRDKAYHRTQQVESSSEDEAMVVSYEVAGLDEFQSFVQSWGPKVTVLDPPELADRIVREARAVIDIYRD